MLDNFKVLICDDSILARKQLKDIVSSLGNPTFIEATDGQDAIDKYKENNPDVVFLDIVMPMVNGIQAARELRWNQPDAEIIFATSEESFALESFDVNPVNYILKPINAEKLFETLDRAVKHLNLDKERTITIKVKGGYSTIHIDDIMYIDYRNHVVSYHLLSKEIISTSTLRIGFAEYLNQNHRQDDFVLCHASVAVSIKAIDKLTKTDIMVRNNEILPVAKSRYAQVAEKYMNYRFRETP